MAKTQPTLEEALVQLEALAGEIEGGQVGLEASIQKYEQGMKLVAQCRAILSKAEQRIQKLQPPGDSPTQTPVVPNDAPAGEAPF